MYLKSLEIQGFKSFTERTLIVFHQGVTAIVGPNGSGKSNVTDAIRWVLGEQSARALRGGKMEDVIFAGTNTRRPLGFAEVTMLIDNSDGILPIEYTEVAITRRLYRSGESNYLINQNPCRLKDIHQLFMDTGLGRDGYSIIGQGRVDEILSTKSEDRRRVFEEASGIQKHKTRRDEALRKLEQTEQNLTRVNDIMTELEAQLAPLKKQAEQAQQYLLWYEELKQLEVALSLHLIDDKSALLKQQRHKWEEVSAGAAEALERSLALEEQHRQLRARLATLQELLHESRQTKDRRSNEREALNERVNTLKTQKEQNKLSQNSHQATITQLQEQVRELEMELSERIRSAQEKSADLEQAKQDVSTRRKALDDFAQKMGVEIEKQNETRASLSLVQHKILDIRSQKSAASLAAEQHATLIREGEEQLAFALKENATLKQEADEIAAHLTTLQEEDAMKQAKLQSYEERLKEARTALAAEQAQYNAQVQQLDQLGYRLDTLRELQQNREGFNEAVRFALDFAKKDPRYKTTVRGSIAELITVPDRYERAIETALGAAVQNLVVADEQTATALITVLKRERKGRVTFLPLNRVKPRFLGSDVVKKLSSWQDKGYIGLAHELLSYPEDITKAMELLLARTVICEDISAATRMAQAFDQSLKIVSLEGDVINPGGAMSGGQYKNQSSLLSRKRLLQEALEQYKKFEKMLPATEKKIAQSEQSIKNLNQESEAIAQSSMILRQDLALQEARAEQNKARCHATAQSLQRLQDRLADLQALTNDQGERLANWQKEEETQLAEMARLEQVLQAQDEDNSQYVSERENYRQALADAESLYNKQFEKMAAEQQIDARIENDKQRLSEQINAREKAIADLGDALIAHETDLLALEEEMRGLMERSGAAEQELQQWEEEQRSLDTRSAEMFERLRDLNQQLNALELEKNRLESRNEQLSNQVDDLRNKLWENYSLTYDNAAAYRDLSLQTQVVGPRIHSLKQSIRGLGAVNVNAVEDYQLISERYEFLKKQEQDILTAKAQLDQLVAELTLTMRQQFTANFAKINENFQLVFKELFGGGKAEISLEAHKDVLEGDIEIKASPPGKKLQNMLLLSGGERSLSAIALLFAILKLRPTPFCVLDEIEAALDDSNVFRFTDYIKNYADKSQFILVTHRKGTMEAADSIYGVTMQELGVSRILSLQLGD